MKIPLVKNLAYGVFNFVRNRETQGNGSQYSPLHAAVQYGCINGDLSVFQYILARTGNKNPKDSHGLTPLHIAVQLNNLEITKQILKKLNGKIPGNILVKPYIIMQLNMEI